MINRNNLLYVVLIFILLFLAYKEIKRIARVAGTLQAQNGYASVLGGVKIGERLIENGRDGPDKTMPAQPDRKRLESVRTIAVQ